MGATCVLNKPTIFPSKYCRRLGMVKVLLGPMPPAEDVLVSLNQARALEGSVLGISRSDIHTLHVSVTIPSSHFQQL